MSWTVADEEALASVAPALHANRRVALGSLALAVAIPVVGIGMLFAGVTAPRLAVSGSGGSWSTITHRGDNTVEITNDGRTAVTVTGIAMLAGDGTPMRGVSDVVVTPTMIPAGATADVRYTFLVDCAAFPATPQDGFAYTFGPLPYSEITVTGTWPWRTTRTSSAGLGDDTFSTYCNTPS